MPYRTLQPFTGDNILHYLKSILSTRESFLGALCSLAAVVMNHAEAAPYMWKGLGLVSLVAFISDLVTGTLRSTRLGLKYAPVSIQKSFNSRDLGATYVKFISYGTVLAVATAIDKGFGLSYVWATVIMGAIAGREIMSNFENLKALYQRYDEPWIFDAAEEQLKALFEAMKRTNAQRAKQTIESIAKCTSLEDTSVPTGTPTDSTDSTVQ